MRDCDNIAFMLSVRVSINLFFCQGNEFYLGKPVFVFGVQKSKCCRQILKSEWFELIEFEYLAFVEISLGRPFVSEVNKSAILEVLLNN